MRVVGGIGLQEHGAAGRAHWGRMPDAQIVRFRSSIFLMRIGRGSL